MKICITSTGENLDSFIDPRFGRCQYFLIVDEKGKLLKAIPNQGVQAIRGAGVTAAQIVANEKVEAVITGNIGPNAFMVLGQSGIKIYAGVFRVKASQALEMFNQGKISECRAPMPGFGRRRGMEGR